MLIVAFEASATEINIQQFSDLGYMLMCLLDSPLLQIFFSNLEESQTADQGLVKRALRFRENLTKKYKWDFTAEIEEDTPTVVVVDQ